MPASALARRRTHLLAEHRRGRRFEVTYTRIAATITYGPTDGGRTLQVKKPTGPDLAVTGYVYGPGGERVRNVVTIGAAAPKQTTYVRSDYEVADDGTITMIPHPGARLVKNTSGTVSTCFVHRDHLASVALETRKDTGAAALRQRSPPSLRPAPPPTTAADAPGWCA